MTLPRRNWVWPRSLALLLGAVLLVFATTEASAKRVIILGFDGLDYDLTQQLMEEGQLPNFQKLADQGFFRPLATAVPPQSPVAWSNFITGHDSGGHGIFDFVHRDAKTLIPYLSTSRTEEGGKSLKLGNWQIPLSGGKVELLRHGTAFWEPLEANGIHTTIVRIPANFPPSGTATRELSGMGTPDIHGTYGLFSYYAQDTSAFDGKDIGGGKVYKVDARTGTVEASLYGPDNPYKVEKEKLTRDFQVYLDPVDPVAKLVVDEEERVLAEGEWTEWIPFEFSMIPTQKLHGMARFYLKEVRPNFQLYVTPINFDPLAPDMPISTPEDFCTHLAEETGRFFTQGMPEDTRALSEGVLDRDEFLAQAKIAGDEVLAQYPVVLSEFEDGLLFYYFGNVDQVCHMMFRTIDPEHPAYDPEKDAPYADVIPSLYRELDEVVGHTLENAGDATIVVMSDHGFTSWRRSFHLNAWLRDEGYLVLKNPNIRKDPGMLLNVDWRRTRAYGMGLNGLFINLRGRERNGIVPPSQKEALLHEIGDKLLQVVDPSNGKPAVTRIYYSDEYYQDHEYLDIGPDMQVGYAKHYRCSNESSLGEVPPEVFSDNTSEWSGDHCMDHTAVPGILLANHPLQKQATSLKNLAAAILAEFGVEAPSTVSDTSSR
jgi:predicted AlkP superfamily phosphohydrolase/phosphomutase